MATIEAGGKEWEVYDTIFTKEGMKLLYREKTVANWKKKLGE